MPAQKITTAGFLSEFLARHKKMSDRPFCWVLGSGASFQSGIPTGGTLAMQWLKELHEMEDFNNLALEKWATADNLGIKGFDFKRAASFYPFIYQRRFRDFREQGYAFLEDAMQQAEPSYGYSVLAQIMAGSQHKLPSPPTSTISSPMLFPPTHTIIRWCAAMNRSRGSSVPT